MDPEAYKFVWDTDLNIPVVIPSNERDLIAQLLESDLQGDLATCQHLINNLEDKRHFVFTGNTISLSKEGDTVNLESSLDGNQSIRTISVDQLLQIIKRWQALLDNRQS